MDNIQLDRIQATLRSLGIPAWLLYSFRDSNPIAVRLLGLTPEVHQSRRWALMIPAHGSPRGLVHSIEPHIGVVMPGSVTSYSSFNEFESGLRGLLEGVPAVAMEYSPNNNVPVVSRVDAGTVEFVRSTRTDVLSSGDLIAALEARLTPEQIASARRAGAAMRDCAMTAFRYIADSHARGDGINEFMVQSVILEEFEHRGLITDHPPIVGVNANSANPHYAPTSDRSSPIDPGDFVLIDLWAREAGEGTIFGDITWTGFAGDQIPPRHAEVFDIVRAARDAAYDFVVAAFREGRKVSGADVDDAARDVIESAGYGRWFTHRTGHSITSELHGAGANIDNFETRDTRTILAGTSFSIEPGIYLPGEFGVRSEIDVVVDHDGTVSATSEPRQQEILRLTSPIV